MRASSAIAALTLAIPLLALGGAKEAFAGGWCDRPAAYYGPPVRAYDYGYAPHYRYAYRPRVVGYGPPVAYYGPPVRYYRAAPVGFRADWGWRRRGFLGFWW